MVTLVFAYSYYYKHTNKLYICFKHFFLACLCVIFYNKNIFKDSGYNSELHEI